MSPSHGISVSEYYQLGLDAPQVRTGLVEAVLDEFPADTFEERNAIEDLTEDLLALADTEAVGSGTTRVTVAAAAIYAADRVTDGKAVTYAALADAAEPIGDTSMWRITTYARDLPDAYRATYGDSDPRVVLNRALALESRTETHHLFFLVTTSR